jgi:hypothetical protein
MIDFIGNYVSIDVCAELDSIPNPLSCNLNGWVPWKVESKEASVRDWQASICMILHCHYFVTVLSGARQACSTPHEFEVETTFFRAEAQKYFPEVSDEVVILGASVVVSNRFKLADIESLVPSDLGSWRPLFRPEGAGNLTSHRTGECNPLSPYNKVEAEECPHMAVSTL